MPSNIVICAASEREVGTAAHLRLPIAAFTYRAGRNGHLYRRFSPDTSCRIMGLDCRDILSCTDFAALSRAAVRECILRRYSGIIITPHYAKLSGLFKTLLPLALSSGIEVYSQDESTIQYSNHHTLIDTAVTQGNLQMKVTKARALFGSDRIALFMSFLQNDFIIPSPVGKGKYITSEKFDKIIEKHCAISYFSAELQSRYFTYSDNNDTHFVLYDDSYTFARKLTMAEKEGISTVFVPFTALQYLPPSTLPDETEKVSI